MMLIPFNQRENTKQSDAGHDFTGGDVSADVILLDDVSLKFVRCFVLEAMRLRDVSYEEMVKRKVETAVGDTSTSVVVKGK